MISTINKKGLCKNQQQKVHLYYLKCSKFTSQNDTKIKRKIGGKNNLYSYFNKRGLKKFETIDEGEISNLLKSLNYI